MKQIVLAGRILYSAMFVLAGLGNFSSQTIAFAAAQGVPLASIAVPFSGVLAMVGGLSIALGYRAKIGALLVALFLVPVTFAMHQFWTVTDPTMAMIQQINFMKNMSMLGGAFVLRYFGSGPLSLDAALRARQSFAMHRKTASAA
jgi:putative oxidoreductase